MADLVTSESRRYLHGIQNTIISDDDTGVVQSIIPPNSQLALVDQMEVDGTLTVYGDAYVTSSKNADSLSGVNHNEVSGRDVYAAHPASSVSLVPVGSVVATDMQSAVAELDAGKVASNPSLTPSTKTKITYDSKGLVTSGNDATASDIAYVPYGGVVAVNVQDAINAVESHASSAQTAANAANAALADIASDGKLTPSEKQSTRLQWDTILGERAGIQARADAVGVSRTTYDSAFQTLATYLNAGTTWSSGTPSWLADANLSTTTPIDGPTFRAKWKALFDARQALLNAITAAAQTTANNASTAAAYADRLARSGNNLIKNGNSEDPNPTGYEAAGLSTGNPYVGSKSRQTVIPAGGTWHGFDVGRAPCAPGDQFVYEAMVADWNGAHYGSRIGLSFLDVGGSHVGHLSLSQLVTSSTYARVEASGTAPAGAAWVVFFCESTGGPDAGGDAGWFDCLYAARKVSAGMLEADAVRSTTHAFAVSDTTASTSTTTGAIVAAGGIATGDYFTGSYRSQDGSAGITDTKTFYAASSSGGSATVLNTVVVKDGIITSWTQA